MAATANASGVGVYKVEPMDEDEINEYYETEAEAEAEAEIKEETHDQKYNEMAQQQGTQDMSTGEHPFEGRT